MCLYLHFCHVAFFSFLYLRPWDRVVRVWKGILGIQDLTKIRCRIRENAKDLDGIRDLTATREARFAKIRARDAGFLPACREIGKSALPK